MRNLLFLSLVLYLLAPSTVLANVEFLYPPESAKASKFAEQIKKATDSLSLGKHPVTVAIGTDSLKAAILNKRPNIVATYITSIDFNRIIQSHDNIDELNIGAVFHNASPKLVISIASKLLPYKKVIALKTPPEKNDFYDTFNSNVTWIELRDKRKNSVLDYIPRDRSVFVIFPDFQFFDNNIIRKFIRDLYFDRNVFTIGFSKEHTKMGALVSIYPKEGYQHKEVVTQILLASNGKAIREKYIEHINISLNRALANSLDIPLRIVEQLEKAIQEGRL